jgi:chromosome segregation ATPase
MLSAYNDESLASLGEVSSSLTAGIEADPDLAKKLRDLQRDLDQHKRLSEALAADVKRLMKERREPLTSADLKESLVELNTRLKHLQEHNKKLTEIKTQKESQIELLTAQVERLKMNAA